MRSSCTRRAGSLRLRLGDEVDAAIGTFNIAEVLSDQGRLDEARAAVRGGSACGVRPTTASAWPASPAPRHRRQPVGRFALAQRAVRMRRVTRFSALVSEHELIDTDARIAEALVLQGRARDALEIADSLPRSERQPRWRYPRPDAAPHPRLRVGADSAMWPPPERARGAASRWREPGTRATRSHWRWMRSPASVSAPAAGDAAHGPRPTSCSERSGLSGLPGCHLTQTWRHVADLAMPLDDVAV